MTPEISAWNSRCEATPVAGAIATSSTTMPTPPSHCVRLRHSKHRFGRGVRVHSDEPVVVNPAMLSKSRVRDAGQRSVEHERCGSGEGRGQPREGHREEAVAGAQRHVVAPGG